MFTSSDIIIRGIDASFKENFKVYSLVQSQNRLSLDSLKEELKRIHIGSILYDNRLEFRIHKAEVIPKVLDLIIDDLIILGYNLDSFEAHLRELVKGSKHYKFGNSQDYIFFIKMTSTSPNIILL